jgi:3-dehydroquinate synthase
MIRVHIALPSQSYDVLIENSLLERAGEHLLAAVGHRKGLFVVTVPPVRRKWGKALMRSLSAAGFTARLVEMGDGERHKKLATVEQLAEKLTEFGADRNAVIVAFGGGVVGDVAGLVASLYMRGVDIVQIPTTVQAQLDAAVGGKTGVNLRAGKNLVGTFHQPRIVIIDPAVLCTLPEREFRAGLYEALKAGVIGSPSLFECLETIRVKALRRDPKALEWVIAESVKLKAEIVSSDERESGLRQVLNFGHTIGHALEAESRYRRFLHGEAVAWGMIAATHIAASLNKCDATVAQRITSAVQGFGPLPKVNAPSGDILSLLHRDKKTRDGVVHFVLPREIGVVEIVNNVSEKLILSAMNELRQLSALQKIVTSKPRRRPPILK